MTDLRLKKAIELGVERNEIEYVMLHDEIGEDFQEQLIALLEAGDFTTYQDYLDEMMQWIIWDNSKDLISVFPTIEEQQLNKAIDHVMNLDELPREILPQTQYLNLTYVMRHLFYNEKDVLSVLTLNQGNTIRFQTDSGERWEIYYDTTSLLTIDKRLDPFDFAVLDAIYTLYKNEIFFFSTKRIDMLLSGNSKRSATKSSIDRIERSIEKLAYLQVQIIIDDEEREFSQLLSVQRFGHSEGSYYYLEKMNDLYSYATEMHQVANVPAAYFDTSTLPKEFKFSDTETSIYIKRRIIARVMGILRQSESNYHPRSHWNRISLIQAKEKKYINPRGRQKTLPQSESQYQRTKKRGLFTELGLMPEIDGLSPQEQKLIMSAWRKKKADYMRVVRGTLEHLKRIYVILDYEEVRPNESKSLREPVIGYDIICFDRTENNALKGMRNEKKAAYVQRLSDRHKSSN